METWVGLRQAVLEGSGELCLMQQVPERRMMFVERQIFCVRPRLSACYVLRHVGIPLDIDIPLNIIALLVLYVWIIATGFAFFFAPRLSLILCRDICIVFVVSMCLFVYPRCMLLYSQ